MQIHTYGYIDSMFYTLNAFAMLVNSDLFAAIIKMLIVVGLASASIAGVRAGNFKAGISVLFTSIIVVNGMLVPKASIEIYDHVTKQRDKVDNLPLGFVLPIGIIESVGIAIASKVDQVLQVPNNTYSYLEYGGTFGASMIQQSKNFKLQDPILANHLEQFIERCVLITAAIGVDFTESDIVNSKNVWGDIIKPKMKDGIREVSLGNKQMGCKTASKIIEDAFLETYKENYGLFKNTRFALSGRDSYTDRNNLPNNIDAYFKKNVESVFGGYLNQNTSALDTIRQITLLHSFSRFGEYGSLRAIQSAESNFDIMGKIAGYYIPMLLTIFKCVSYIGFIFVIPVMIITGNMDRFKKYLILIASFQIWPVISSILNMFVDLYSATSFSDLSRAGGISLSTLSTIENTSDIIVAVASSLQMSVPVISYAFISGGIDAITSFHGNLTSAMNQGSSIASSEMLSGNKNFDNENIGNTNNFKTDRSSSYKSDSSLMEYADGSTMRQLSSGKELYSSGSGITEHQTPFKFDLSSSMQSIAEERVAEQASVVEESSNAYTKSKSETIDQMAEMMTLIDDHISSGDSLGLSEKIAKNKELSGLYNIGKQDSKDKNSSFKASFSLGLADIANFEYSTDSSNNYSEKKENNKSLTELVSQISDVTKDENTQKTLGISEQSISKMNESASQTKTLEDRHSKQIQDLKSKESVASKVKSNSITKNQDITDEVIVGTASDLGIHQRDTISKIHSGDHVVRKKADEVAYNIANRELDKLGSTPNLNNSSYTEKTNNYEGMRERAPQFENKYNKPLEGSIKDKVRAKIETGKINVNKKRSDLEAKGNEKRGEFVGKFNVGEESIDKESIDKNIKDREERFEATEIAREVIDGGLSKGKEFIGDNVMPNSVKKLYGNVKKSIVDKDTSSSENQNESAKQIDKDKK